MSFLLEQLGYHYTAFTYGGTHNIKLSTGYTEWHNNTIWMYRATVNGWDIN